ncbi:MAG: TIGR02594 family protein [Cyclobacteriaceae bacterium]
MSNLIEIAAAEIGTMEAEGIEHNPRILQYAEEAGFSQVDDDETPWCSIFMNWVASKSGLVRSKSGAARSWLTVGQAIETPEPGDVVIFWRVRRDSWQGHVGIFMGFSRDGSRIYCLGGNQGNQVSISAYSANQLLGFRRLYFDGKAKLKSKTLKLGDSGDDVQALQDALKMANFNPGTSDGFYGPKTETAVKELQSTLFGLEVSGIFNSKTRKHLLSLLN